MRLRAEHPDCVHLTKLAVGVPSLDAFEARVQARREAGQGMQVWTRSLPKRAADVLRSGSLYWVVAGLLSARQRVLAIEEDRYDDGSRCCRIEVEPSLVRVSPLPVRPFQGWRYLLDTKAPPDLTRGRGVRARCLAAGSVSPSCASSAWSERFSRGRAHFARIRDSSWIASGRNEPDDLAVPGLVRSAQHRDGGRHILWRAQRGRVLAGEGLGAHAAAHRAGIEQIDP